MSSSVFPVPLSGIQESIFDAKGDLIVASAADSPARLAVASTAGYVLTVDSGETTGLKWAAAASGGMTLLATINPSSASTLSFTSISGSYKHLFLQWAGLYNDFHAGIYWGCRLNNDSGSNYASASAVQSFTSPSTKTLFADSALAETQWTGSYGSAPIGLGSNSAWNKRMYGNMWLFDYANTSDYKYGTWGAYTYNNSDAGVNAPMVVHGVWNSTSAINRVDFVRSSTQVITGGYIKLYGVS